MKHPARWLIALALLACTLAWWWNRPPPEPVFRGQPLFQWMLDSVEQEDMDRSAAYHEIRALGPPVVAWLAYTAEHGRTHHGQPGVIRELLARIGWRDTAPQSPLDYDERMLAMSMLGELGPTAKPAVPALLRNLNSTSYDHVLAAAGTLHLMGSDSWPVVEDQLTHGSNLARCELLGTMWLRFARKSDNSPESDPPESDVIKGINLLEQALHNEEPNIRRNAAYSISQIIGHVNIPGPLIDQVALALWVLPGESNKEIRAAKNELLDFYSKTSKEAIPRLTALLTDPDEAKRSFARAILGEIDPGSTKAEAP